MTAGRLKAAALALAFLLPACAGSRDRAAPRESPRPKASSPGPITGLEQTPLPAVETSATPSNVYAYTRTGNLAPEVGGVPHRVYVPNSESNTVSVINPRSLKVVREFPVGDYVQHVTPSWDLRALYANNTAGKSLTVINPLVGVPTRTIPVLDPYNLYFTPDGTKAIVVAKRLRRLEFRDPVTFELIKSLSIPAEGPDHLDFSADGRYLLINAELSGYVLRVSARSMRITGKMRVGGEPIDVRLSPDGSVFYVANQALSGVSVIDPKPMRQIRFIRTGAGAHGLAVSRDTRLLYVSNRLAGSISLIRFATRKVVATWDVGGSPDMMQLSPDGSQLWVSNRYHRSVSVIDTDTGRVIKVIRVGVGPHGLSYFPQPGRFSIGHNGNYR